MAKEVDTINSVCPSGVACATMVDASVLPAPERFSMTTGCPHISASLGPISRAVMSVALPGEKPTTMRTGFVGNFCCVCAIAGAAPPEMTAMTLATIV